MGGLTTKSGRKHLAFALDYSEVNAASIAVEQVAPYVGVLKIGLEMFVREGPAAIRLGADFGCDIFLDLKLHDIPETVERAVANAYRLGVRYLTVHASGGPRMLAQAVERVSKEGGELTLLAVTVLTSLDGSDLEAMGIRNSPGDQALALARMAQSVVPSLRRLQSRAPRPQSEQCRVPGRSGGSTHRFLPGSPYPAHP